MVTETLLYDLSLFIIKWGKQTLWLLFLDLKTTIVLPSMEFYIIFNFVTCMCKFMPLLFINFNILLYIFSMH